MGCQECQQRPATFHFTQFKNGQKTEVRLCEVCAKEKGYMTFPEDGYSLHHLLSGLFNFDLQQVDSHQDSFHQLQHMACRSCGLSLMEFKNDGKFGCASCYESFAQYLDSILRRVHSGNTKHNGKTPKRQGAHLHTKKELEMLKVKLNELVKREEFEEAAVVRDQIKALEKSMNSTEAGGDE